MTSGERRSARFRARAVLPALVVLAIAAQAGCERLVGIEERYYDPTANGGGGSTRIDTPECQKYCSDVMKNCTDDFQVYASLSTCLGVCALLDPGDTANPSGNSRACRANQAELAGQTHEPAVHCPRAGPAGADVCGSNCEGYCTLLDRACSASFPDCVDKCPAFSQPGSYKASIVEGDTLWCRLSQLGAATITREGNCDRAGVLPTSGCVEPPDSVPTCADYCRIVMLSCAGDRTVYESAEQCMDACSALVPGVVVDRTENTLGCRKYHAYSALLDATTHCPHASPSGDGYCGDPATGNCTSYCLIAEAACGTQFRNAFGSQDACLADCQGLEGAGEDAYYSVKSAESGNTVSCRILHASRAFSAPSACSAAFGASPCD